jgi:hypothetical protein
VAVALVMVIGAGVDLGLWVTARQSMSAATTVAGREAAYGGLVYDIAAVARQFATGTMVNPRQLNIQVAYSRSGGAPYVVYCDNRTMPPLPPPCTNLPTAASPTDFPGPIGPAARGDQVKVTVIYDQYELLTPFLRPAFFGSGCSDGSKRCLTTLTNSDVTIYPGPP